MEAFSQAKVYQGYNLHVGMFQPSVYVFRSWTWRDMDSQVCGDVGEASIEGFLEEAMVAPNRI